MPSRKGVPNYRHQWKLMVKNSGFELHWCARCGTIRYEHSGYPAVFLQPGYGDTNNNIPPCKEQE